MPRHALLASLLLMAAVAAADETLEVTPTADLRVRQEVLDGVYHFDDEPDRDWLRVRTRLGFEAAAGARVLALRVVNEHRHHFTPDRDFDWDEVLIDRLSLGLPLSDATHLTIGRQDIVWKGGFLVLEGHPLDGSRTIFHDGVRLRHQAEGASWDLALVHNRQEALLVLAGDEDRPLTFGDETGLLARVTHAPWTVSFIVKHEDWDDDVIPGDLTTYTGGLRHDGAVGGAGWLEAELAVQRQTGTVLATIPYPVDTPVGDGWALAGQAFLTWPLDGRKPRVAGSPFAPAIEVGGFYYSGAGADLRPFKAPWGNWPKWSELYIYTLLGESTPGRPHVAAWENIAAPRATLRWGMGTRLTGRVGATWLTAPEPAWVGRGVLLQAQLTAFLPHGLRGHLLYEWFDPGPFHDGRYGLAAMTDPVGFLRWQLAWRF